MMSNIPKRHYEVIEPYFLPNFVYALKYIKEKSNLDRIDVEPVILHLLYSIEWCNQRQSDFWIRRDKEILIEYLKEIVNEFRVRLPSYYAEFKDFCPNIILFEKVQGNPDNSDKLGNPDSLSNLDTMIKTDNPVNPVGTNLVNPFSMANLVNPGNLTNTINPGY